MHDTVDDEDVIGWNQMGLSPQVLKVIEIIYNSIEKHFSILLNIPPVKI